MAKGRRATKSKRSGSKRRGSRRMMGGQKMCGGQKMYGGQKMCGGQKMYGGAHSITPAPLNDSSILGASKLNLAQGGDYLSLHAGQHGGAMSFANAAPPGYTGMLDPSLVAAARTGPTMESLNAASGMKDQGGGGRRRRRGSRRGKKGSRRAKRRGTRRQRGGAAMTPFSTASDAGAPGMLLSPGMEQKAMMGMHTQEWKLAENPASFAPRM